MHLSAVPCILEDICVWISEYYKPNVFSNHFYQRCYYCIFSPELILQLCCYYCFSLALLIPDSYFVLISMLGRLRRFLWLSICADSLSLRIFQWCSCLWSEPGPTEGDDLPSLSIRGQPRLILPLPFVLQPSGVLEASPERFSFYNLHMYCKITFSNLSSQRRLYISAER